MPEAESTQPELRRTQAAVRRSRWPGWIWMVPLAAAILLAWLGVRFFLARGPSATVLFDDATGVSPQNTKVTYRGVNVGEVSGISLSPDGRHVRVQLSLDQSANEYLRSGTRFWLQGPSLENPLSLGAILSGPTIEIEPGPGAARRTFVGLPEPPAFTEPVEGSRFTLVAGERGSLHQGSGIYYLGLQVGKIINVQMSSPHQFHFDVLVRAPYDRLVHRGSRFWDAGALHLSLASGVKLQLSSPLALLEGAVAFETSSQAATQPPSQAGEMFQLYPSQASAELASAGPYALYQVQFSGAVGDLKVGAPVKLHDFTVGQVREVNFELDARTGALRTPVTLELDADRLHIAAAGSAQNSDWNAVLNHALAHWVHEGLRARLAQAPELIGPYYVTLDFVHAAPAVLNLRRRPPEIPAGADGGLGALAAQLGALPIEQIGVNLQQITARVRMLVSSPELQDSLQHVDSSLATIDTMVRGAAPQMKPLIVNLRRTAAQLDGVAMAAHQTLGGVDEQGGLDEAVAEVTRAARSVRVLADYLEQHPEALLTGKR